MKTQILATALVLTFTGIVSADDAPVATDTSDCQQVIAGMNLIMPSVSITNAVELSDEVIAVLTPGKDYLGDSVHAVNTDYTPELHASIRDNFAEHGASIGVVEGTDGHGDPALWIYVWSQGPEACTWAMVDNRVYEERGNAPNVFWDAVRQWEDENPEGVLVRASIN